jgi:protein-disulfide isomerase
VTLVEYASATCSHCARFDRDVFPTLKARYIDTGKIRYVFREFLTPPVPVAAAAFVLARCAGKDKYFQVVEAVFRSQEEMFATQDSRTPLLRIAKSMGMTEESFNTCLSDSAALDAVQKRMDRGVTEDKIEGTPTFLVNGKQVATGETTLEVLAKALDTAAAAPAKK